MMYKKLQVSTASDMKGDHKPSKAVDINIKKPFVLNTHTRPKTNSREITSKDRTTVTKYLAHFNNHII